MGFQFLSIFPITLTVIVIALLVWKAAPGDIAGFGAMMQQWRAWDITSGHSDRVSLLGAILSVRLVLTGNFYIAHELLHRRSSQISTLSGDYYWLPLAIRNSLFPSLWPRKHVATSLDPASARRGQSLYRFVVQSAVGQFTSAYVIERNRLMRTGRSVMNYRNRFFVGQAMTIALAGIIFLFAGWQAFVAWLICALYAKFIYESVNYVQHYGLVRVPGMPIEPRHSWDSAAAFSSAFLMNLTRHADHHARATVPYWELRHSTGAPQLWTGYLSAVSIALFPKTVGKHLPRILIIGI
jgi:fatty acid desaturase